MLCGMSDVAPQTSNLRYRREDFDILRT